MFTLSTLDANKCPELRNLLDQISALIDLDPVASVGLLEEAISLALPLNDFALLSTLYNSLGICNVVLHNPLAIRNYEAALDMAVNAHRPDLKVDALHGLGRTFLVFGEVSTSLEYNEKALQLARELGEINKFPKILLTLGLVFGNTRQYERNIGLSREAAECAASLGDLRFHAHALNNWADGLTSQFLTLRDDTGVSHAELLDEAIEHARKALLLVRQNGFVRLELLAAETLAHAMEQKGNYAEAVSHLEDTLQRLQGHGFVKEVLDIHLRMGALLFRLGRVQDGIELLTTTHAAAIKLGNYPHLADLLKDLCDANETQGDFSAALSCMREYHLVVLKQMDHRSQISAQIYAAKMDLERAQKEVEAHKSRVNQLENFNRSLSVQANEDPLTSLPNRRALEESMALRLTAANIDFVFIMCDIDFFKKVNDNFSHLIGDDVLRQIGVLLVGCLRSNDMAARIGGEEFALVLDHCKPEKLIEACNRIRKIVEKYQWGGIAEGLQITMSFGVTSFQEGDTLKSLMTRADDALYRAKRNGRNRAERA